MNVLFLAKYVWPHVGGVERHIKFLIYNLQFLNKNTKITTISEEDIKPPYVKIIGLLYIWYWLFKNRNLIINADIIHIHDVFIWYLPFRFLFPRKKVYITFHGWEGKYPIPFWNLLNKKIANKLTNGSIAVGKYIEKWYGIKATYTTYGGVQSTVNSERSTVGKIKNTIVWLGRIDKDTGYFEFQKWLSKEEIKYDVRYIINKPNPEKYLKTAEYCVPSGYLSYLEAKSYGCKIITFANNPLKEDYWKEIEKLKAIPSWSEVAKTYIKLWQK